MKTIFLLLITAGFCLGQNTIITSDANTYLQSSSNVNVKLVFDKSESFIGGGYNMVSFGINQGKGVSILSTIDSTFSQYSVVGTDGTNVILALGGPDGPAQLVADWATGNFMFEDARLIKKGIEYTNPEIYVTQPGSFADKQYVDKNQLTPYTTTTLPAASPAGKMIFVTDLSPYPAPAYSDSLHWRRITDGSIITP